MSSLDTGSGWIVKSDDAMRNGFLNLFTDNSLTCQLTDDQLADTTSRRHSKLLTSKISAESLQNVQGHMVNWGHTRPHPNPYPDPNPKALTLSLNPKPLTLNLALNAKALTLTLNPNTKP